ncbi:MAG: CPBP family intramembrane glutamic endopeptidase [Bacteroidales bacterium]
MGIFQSGSLQHLSPVRKIIALILLSLFSMLVIMLIGWLIATMVFVNVSTLMTQLNDYQNIEVVRLLKYFQIINQIGLFIIPPVLFAFLDSDNIWRYLGLTRKPQLWVVALSLIIIIAILPLIHVSTLFNEQLKLPVWLQGLENWMRQSEINAENLTKAFLDVKTTGGFLVNIFMIALIPAVGEELLFRGVLQKLLHRWFGNVHWAVLLTAVVFSAMHLQFYGFLPRMILGISFGYLFVITQSLWVPIIVHFFNNGMAVIAAFLFQKKFIENNYDEIGQVSDPLLIIASLIMVFTLFVVITRLSDNQGKTNTQI